MPLVDTVVAAALLPLALWLLASGVDDLLVDLWWLVRCRLPRVPPLDAPEKLTAIYVPLWQEDAVIRGMVEHNRAAIDYSRCHFFLGAYPNDEPTLSVLRELSAEHASIHLALCPHDGPTSKADCLNWIYQRMLLYEEENGVCFETILIHDAEDLIHPHALRAVNALLETYDMVQLPVLALPTPWHEFTHGIYCDEFAEYQIRDMPVRQNMGAFVPSCGVGTGYRRDVLARLAGKAQNRIFEPACLTEDYENGFRLHALGARQAFVPVVRSGTGFLATREYFPRMLRSAVVQRTRWACGNVLQSWERHGWTGGLTTKYWLWRDRKSLAGSLVTTATNAIAFYGVATLAVSSATGRSWHFGAACGAAAPLWMIQVTTALLLWRLAFRMWCSSRVYGPLYALGVPLRVLHANCINSTAAISAVYRFVMAKWHGQPLRWVKTAHSYPSREALHEHKRTLREVIIGAAYLDEEEFERALRGKPAAVDDADYLLRTGCLSEDDLVEILSLRHGIPVIELHSREIPRRIGRALPARVVREWTVLPFRIENGNLHLAGPRPPSDAAQQELRRLTSLRLRFHLVTRREWDAVVRDIL